ncbi:MAG: hypothetical protein KGH93_03015 [Patescibacteria group bacterium]|nr:hypothetical protein [Patescibacteria group bacterium]MDE1946141.1 hypothetical protein [Patescibacteria group bacterium]
MGKAKQFCAGIYVRKFVDSYYILGLTKNDSTVTQLPGGTDENAPWENKDETFRRELPEETGFLPTAGYEEVFSQPRNPTHTQYFYSMSEARDTWADQKGPLEVGGERMRVESDGDTLHVCWFEIEDFLVRIHLNHKTGCIKGLAHLASRDDGLWEHLYEIAKDPAFGELFEELSKVR